MTRSDARQLVELDVNGRSRQVAVESRQTLLEVLRTELDVPGTKEVCEMGNCGACTVLTDDMAVYSCLVLAVECDDIRVETVESLADGDDLDVVQQAFVDCDALQCGYCTPGQIMSLEALRRRGPTTPEPADIQRALEGNLCRCGAYRNILAAADQIFGVDRTAGTR